MSTRQIFIGPVAVGGGAPVSVQSMCNTPTADVAATLNQIQRLAAAGCEIIRLAVPDMAAAEAFRIITGQSPIPVIADIHFDYRLALAAIENGAAAIRVNPGNLGNDDAVKAVAGNYCNTISRCGWGPIPAVCPKIFRRIWPPAA